MELPSHPDTGDSMPDHRRSPGVSWGAVLAVAAVAAVVVLLVILHLSGVVGPAAQ